MGECDECYRTELCLERDHRSIENRTGGTHPGAEQSAVGGCLMLGMVPGMFDRLSLCQSANGEEAEYQEDRQTFKGAVFHRKATQYNCFNATGARLGLSRRRVDVGSLKKAEG